LVKKNETLTTSEFVLLNGTENKDLNSAIGWIGIRMVLIPTNLF